MGIKIDKEKCIGCSLCASMYPEVFEIEDLKAEVKKEPTGKLDDLKCPVDAITQTKPKTK